MTIVNTETGEIVEVTYAEVRDSIAAARESGTKFFEQIVWQIERQAWTVLGYSSWDEMRETEYADMGVVVPRADRPEVVTRMRKSGLTQAQIADTLGVDRKTVRADLNGATPHSDGAAPIINARGQQRPAAYTRTPAPEPDGEAGDDAEVARDEAVPTSLGAPRPDERRVDLGDFIKSDPTVQLTSWRKHYMAAIAKSGDLMLFTPQDVAEKADVDLINELERLSRDLNNYVSRVHAARPQRLTAIRGGLQ